MTHLLKVYAIGLILAIVAASVTGSAVGDWLRESIAFML